MKSEDIARYVAGLEEEVERVRSGQTTAYAIILRQVAGAVDARQGTTLAELPALVSGLRAELATKERQRANCFKDMQVAEASLHELQGEVERLRTAQPALPDVGPVTSRSDGEFSEWLFPDGLHYEDSDLELDSPQGRAVHIAKLLAIHQHLLVDEAAEAAAADTTPDTSRVTFGTRDEGTGMVLLHHADSMFEDTVYGDDARDRAEWHRSFAVDPNVDARSRSIHAALAEVREALNTAEANGVDVWDADIALCRGTAWGHADPSVVALDVRARAYLATEVQALVDQGLRGDDLNARVPYEVRDHRAPVEAADTSSDDEPCNATMVTTQGREVRCILSALHDSAHHGPNGNILWTDEFAASTPHACTCPNCREARNVLAAHRAARTGDEASLVHFKPYGSYQSSCGISPLKEGPSTTDERARTTCQDCRACFRNPSDVERAAPTSEEGCA